ncbi:FecR family protein [Methylosinus sp. Sm6]|uniref:FecR family protein n=1 Tax=Methylosinus sp. Sm6 TaxID=2866948 RepID=UPI001C998759|nr:FecR domain-containing protein [Methylosinus sp. Sm6]MBY6240317.1 FecR domain-containing protein [Methylosinus sp. Sm6]
MVAEPDETGARSGAAHEAAIEWWVLAKAGELSGARRADFEAWLAADPAHAAAYADIARMFEEARALRPAHAPAKRASRRPTAALAALLAASLAVFACFDHLSILLQADHATGVAESKSVTLSDGSRVELDAGSAIALRFEPGRRVVRLLAGEAWFVVAPDAARPFVVEAAGGSVTALGTAFDVALREGGAHVSVGEHRVAVASGGARVEVGERQSTAFETAAPGQPPVSVAADAIAAWRRGALVVEDRPLGEVLATLARYRHGAVLCLRPSTCARRVSGVFSTSEPLTTLREIEFFLGLRAVQLTSYLIFLTE